MEKKPKVKKVVGIAVIQIDGPARENAPFIVTERFEGETVADINKKLMSVLEQHRSFSRFFVGFKIDDLEISTCKALLQSLMNISYSPDDATWKAGETGVVLNGISWKTDHHLPRNPDGTFPNLADHPSCAELFGINRGQREGVGCGITPV